jgi:SP family general alpha glucoside:H+ symporter-like MFS transporter
MNGWACDRFGYLRTMTISLVAIIGFIFITFFAHNIEMLLVGELLCGIPWVSPDSE